MNSFAMHKRTHPPTHKIAHASALDKEIRGLSDWLIKQWTGSVLDWSASSFIDWLIDKAMAARTPQWRRWSSKSHDSTSAIFRPEHRLDHFLWGPLELTLAPPPPHLSITTSILGAQREPLRVNHAPARAPGDVLIGRGRCLPVPPARARSSPPTTFPGVSPSDTWPLVVRRLRWSGHVTELHAVTDVRTHAGRFLFPDEPFTGAKRSVCIKACFFSHPLLSPDLKALWIGGHGGDAQCFPHWAWHHGTSLGTDAKLQGSKTGIHLRLGPKVFNIRSY